MKSSKFYCWTRSLKLEGKIVADTHYIIFKPPHSKHLETRAWGRKNFGGRPWLSPPTKYFSEGAPAPGRKNWNEGAPEGASESVSENKPEKIHFTVKFLLSFRPFLTTLKITSSKNEELNYFKIFSWKLWQIMHQSICIDFFYNLTIHFDFKNAYLNFNSTFDSDLHFDVCNFQRTLSKLK